MIWELLGKMSGAVFLVVIVAVAVAETERRRINLIAWQKRTQAAMDTKRAEMVQAAADREVCAQLELLPASEESND